MNEEVSKKEAQDVIDNLRSFISLVITSIPFCMPMLGLDIQSTNDPKITIKTNGKWIKVNPTFWKKLTPSEKEGTVMSQWLHIALLDIIRQDGRIDKVWKAACAFRSSSMILTEANKINNVSTMTLPEGALFDTQFNNKSAEEVYTVVLKAYEKALKDKANNQQQNKPSQGQPQQQKGKGQSKSKYIDKDALAESLANDSEGSGTGDDFEYADDTLDQEELKREIVRAAEIHEMMQGNMPGFYKALVQEIKEAQMPWEQMLAMLVRTALGSGIERTYQKTKRYGCLFDMILPSETGKKKPRVVVIIDTSGSISEHYISSFVTEITKILRGVSECICITADAKVQEVVKVRSIRDFVSEQPKVNFLGRGGTNFVPALQEAAKKRADLVIYFTDGYGTFGNSPFGIKRLLWVMTTNVVPPFGRHIKMR